MLISKFMLEKPYKKCDEEASPKPIYKKSKLNISLECFKVSFCCMSKSRSTKTMLKLRCWSITFILHKAFFQNRGLDLVSLSHFIYVFWRKIFPMIYSINRPNFIVRFSLQTMKFSLRISSLSVTKSTGNWHSVFDWPDIISCKMRRRLVICS